MIQIADNALTEYLETKTGSIKIYLNYGSEEYSCYESFFNALNKNKNVDELSIQVIYSTQNNNYDLKDFIKYFRLPENIKKLRLPSLHSDKRKIVMPMNIEELTLENMSDLIHIDFTKNQKLEYIKIFGECGSDCFEEDKLENYIEENYKTSLELSKLNFGIEPNLDNLTIDLSHLYNLKKFKFSPHDGFYLIKNIKFPYGCHIQICKHNK